MTKAKMIWVPHPYDAGFCISDDPDASTYEQTRIVYDYLISKSFTTTKAVWTFNPVEECGIPPTPNSTLRGVTLEDSRYLAYCKELGQHGFELCLHGASAGNNRREYTRDAFDFISAHFHPSDTFICHSKNADNVYWEDKATSLFPFHTLLRAYSRHSCSGESTQSPYYWGDLCSSQINQIRLFRTRCRNTLDRNPSMPYYDPRKPLANGWFSATKRSLADCATEEALDCLKSAHGLTVLYQYLHRYADSERNKPSRQFVKSVERISSDSRIFVRTVSSIMKRLRQLQGIFIVYEEKSFWLINVTDEDIENIQIVSNHPLGVETTDDCIVGFGCTTVIRTLPRKSLTFVRTSNRVVFSQKNAVRMSRNKCLTHRLPFGELLINLSGDDWHMANGGSLPHGSFHLKTLCSGTGIPLLSALSVKEELGLVTDQVSLIGREVMFKGRCLNAKEYLDGSKEIPLENHDIW